MRNAHRTQLAVPSLESVWKPAPLYSSQGGYTHAQCALNITLAASYMGSVWKPTPFYGSQGGYTYTHAQCTHSYQRHLWNLSENPYHSMAAKVGTRMRIAHTAISAISGICLKTRIILWQPRWLHACAKRIARTAISVISGNLFENPHHSMAAKVGYTHAQSTPSYSSAISGICLRTPYTISHDGYQQVCNFLKQVYLKKKLS